MSKLSSPTIIVNFKTYEEVEGAKAASLAQVCQQVSEDTGICIAVCPPMVELSAIVRLVRIPILAQHVDDKKPGANTGWVTPQGVAKAGAIGTLINHSEHRVPSDVIHSIIDDCRSAGLLSIVCADSDLSARDYASFRPDYIAVEPPELIGGNVSVTSAKPEVVSDSVNAVRSVDQRIKVLCGAGVKTGADVKKALELGSSGVLLASGVVKAKDPKKALEDLISQVKL